MDNTGSKRVLVLNSEEDAKRKYGDVLLNKEFEFIYYTGSTIDPESIIASYEPHLLLLSLEWLSQERLMAFGAKRRNIPVIYVMDGIIEWSYIWENDSYIRNTGTCLQPLVADFLCVIGRSSARYLSTLGLESRIRVIGLPRLDRYDRKRLILHSERKKILIATANTYALNSNQLVNVKAALRDLKNFFDEIVYMEPVWRIDSQLANELDVQAASSEQSLDSLLNSVDCVVSFSSTLIIEAMLKDIPVSIVDYRAIPILTTSAWQIRSREHIEIVLKELITPPLEKIALQRSCLENELEVGCASEKLLAVMKEALSGETTQKFDSSTDYFGPIEFSYVHSQVSLFSTTEKSLLQYELDGCYRHIKKSNEQFGDLVDSLEKNWFVRAAKAVGRLFGYDELPVLRKLNRLAGRN
jgi:hypothetical protein